MGKRNARRQREQDQLSPTLNALMKLIPAGVDSRRFLEETYGLMVSTLEKPCASAGNGGATGECDSVITGAGLTRLVEALGDACPGGSMDLVRIARRAPRCQSTAESVLISELCFALSQATAPTSVHERRRRAADQVAILDEDSALMQYYKDSHFRTISRSVGCSPAATEGEESVEVTSEWQSFLASVRTPLPMSLRVHKNESALQHIAQWTLTEAGVHRIVRPVAALPPSAGVYSCSNADYHSHPQVEYTCRILHAASAVSFQEVVSAIPVLVLGVEPYHTVLDMCAAPGSKTLQALDEMLRKGWDAPELRSSVLVANEKDRVKATQTLPARLKRFHAPNVMSTRCDAVQWPRLYVTEGGALGQYKDDERYCPVEQQFDRIICDVPCSGDGTLRKEPSVAATWSPGYVKSLVPTQVAILRRGLEILADKGILVYSTCSLNPKEDEEVVCAALEMFGDAVELLDVNAVLREKGAHLRSSGGVAAPDVGGLRGQAVPVGYDGARVLRVLPHRDDTGGFFIAAFRKVRPFSVSPAIVVRKKLSMWTKAKVWAPISQDDPVWTSIASFYGFDCLDPTSFSYYPASCGNEKRAQGLVPVYHLNVHGGPTRRIVLATPALASMLFGTRPYKGPGVEVVCVGVRAFDAYDGKFLSHAECRWRAVVESASYFAPRFTKRKMLFNTRVHHAMVEELLRSGFVYVREYWQTILCDPTVASLNSDRDAPFPFVKDGPLKSLLAEAPGANTTEAETELGRKVSSFLASELHVGGVLLGLIGSRTCTEEATEEPWFLSATLNGNKLELAVDVSLRTYGLMAYLDIRESAQKATNGDGGPTTRAGTDTVGDGEIEADSAEAEP